MIEKTEKLLFLSQRLVELQRSQAVFKDSVLNFIELLERGFGTIHASHHNNVLSVDLGFSDAQCQCIECVEGQNSETDNVEEKVSINYTTDLFTFIDENSQFPKVVYCKFLLRKSCFDLDEINLSKCKLFFPLVICKML